MNGYKSSQHTPWQRRRRCMCAEIRALVCFWVCGCTASDGCALCSVDMTVIQIHKQLLWLILLKPAHLSAANDYHYVLDISIYSTRLAWHITGSHYQDQQKGNSLFCVCMCSFFISSGSVCSKKNWANFHISFFTIVHSVVQIYALIRN